MCIRDRACALVEIDLQLLLQGGQASVFLQVAEQGGQIDGLCGARIRVQAGQCKNFADQRFQSITLLTQTGPEPFSLLGIGALRQCQCNTQARQGLAQFVGNIAQQLTLAADQALQALAHAVEVLDQ